MYNHSLLILMVRLLVFVCLRLHTYMYIKLYTYNMFITGYVSVSKTVYIHNDKSI